jgi:hypothetical protein
MTEINVEAYHELASACHLRAAERDKAQGELLTGYALDHERRSDIARMLGVSTDHECNVPGWDVLMVRLNECLTTLRRRS